ncbi:MAG: hypothetical protein ABIG61_12030 [Planctomycetota bacterium]
MHEVVTNAENFKCPCCNKEFGEETLIELCNEPFNGIVVECEDCEKEYDCTLQIHMQEI